MLKKLIAEVEKEFDKRYMDKNSISGLNQKKFKNFIDLTRDTKQFLTNQITKSYEAGFMAGTKKTGTYNQGEIRQKLLLLYLQKLNSLSNNKLN